ELLEMDGFNRDSMLCLQGEDEWMPAKKFRALKEHFVPDEQEELLVELPPKNRQRTHLERIPAPRSQPRHVIYTGDVISPNYLFARTRGKVLPRRMSRPKNYRVMHMPVQQTLAGPPWNVLALMTAALLIAGAYTFGLHFPSQRRLVVLYEYFAQTVAHH